GRGANGRGPALKQETCGTVILRVPVRGWRQKWTDPSSVAGEDTAELVHLLQRLAGTAHHASQWIIGNDDWQPGLLHEQPIDVTQQRSATSKDHPLLGDVCPQFWWCLLKGGLDRADDSVQRFG